MQVNAVLKNVNISPLKVRLVADLVRGQRAIDALALLKFSPKAAAKPVAKVIKSALHNATHNLSLKGEDMVISKICVDQAQVLKRIKPRARGRADRIIKRRSHISVVLEDSN